MHEFIAIKIVSRLPSSRLRNNQDGCRSNSISKARFEHLKIVSASVLPIPSGAWNGAENTIYFRCPWNVQNCVETRSVGKD